LGRVLRRLAPNAADADDLCQETFVRVLLASRRYRPTGEFSAWLYRIELNLARDAEPMK
jgi:RNA polymerase sigma-70 factor (ECF subfamily)